MPHRDDILFKALIETAVDGIAVIDSQGTVLVFSESCARLFGYASQDVVGHNISLLMPEPDRGAHDGYLAHYLRTGEKKIIGSGREVIGRRKDGSTFPMYLSVGEGMWNGDRIFVAVIRDLTELHAEIARRQDASNLLAQIVESSNDAIISKTLGGVITSWNKAAEDIFGYAADEAIGRSITILIPPDRLVEEESILGRIQAGRSIEHYETVRRRKDGSNIDVSLSVSPVRDSTGTIIGAAKIVRDITQQRRDAAKLLSVQSELAHVSRLNAMGQMASALAHELNQPLTAISNYVKAARRVLERPDDGAVSRAFDIIDKAMAQVMRAGAIIRSLRDFVERRESHRAPQNINEVVEEAVTLGLIGAAQDQIRVRLDLDQSLPLVMIDKVQIQQVLINLFRNGIEAMQSVERRELCVATRADGTQFAQITVSDSGTGLSEAVQRRLFQPFVTTKEKGMGIGLTICQSIVEAHGGTILALSNAPQGAAFTFRVPFVEQKEAA